MEDAFIEGLRETAYELARHEAGHFVIARVLGYSSNEVFIIWSGIGAGGGGGNSVMLEQYFDNLDEIVDYCSHRVIMLYAGSMAENVIGGRVIYERVEDDLNTLKASDDFSKIRENIRIIAGITRSDGKDIQLAINRVDDDLRRRAADLVVRYDDNIEALAKELQQQIKSPGVKASVKNWNQPELGAELNQNRNIFA